MMVNPIKVITTAIFWITISVTYLIQTFFITLLLFFIVFITMSKAAGATVLLTPTVTIDTTATTTTKGTNNQNSQKVALLKIPKAPSMLPATLAKILFHYCHLAKQKKIQIFIIPISIFLLVHLLSTHCILTMNLFKPPSSPRLSLGQTLTNLKCASRSLASHTSRTRKQPHQSTSQQQHRIRRPHQLYHG